MKGFIDYLKIFQHHSICTSDFVVLINSKGNQSWLINSKRFISTIWLNFCAWKNFALQRFLTLKIQNPSFQVLHGIKDFLQLMDFFKEKPQRQLGWKDIFCERGMCCVMHSLVLCESHLGPSRCLFSFEPESTFLLSLWGVQCCEWLVHLSRAVFVQFVGCTHPDVQKWHRTV